MQAMLHYPLARLRDVLTAHLSPGRLAAAVTLGMLVGLMPKQHLLTLVLLAALLSLRVNKMAAIASVAAFSLIGWLVAPLAHTLGLAILHLASLQDTYLALYELPLGPWLGFHNTVVAGGLILGLYFAFPVYRISRALCSRIDLAVAERIRRRRLLRWIAELQLGAPWGAAP